MDQATENQPNLDTRNVNSLWATVLVETLVRAGVTRAVVAPGSRSTPITMALAAHGGIEAIPVLDERSAAFFALGLAKQKLKPVALVCTSGTAGANFFPAIIEAHESAVPLLVLTADRPPELRACSSGQTIDQQKLFGDYVNFYHELAIPGLTAPLLRYLRQTVAHAVARTILPYGGPVHLNIPFRDPLPPIPDGGETEALAGTIDWDRFFTLLTPMEPAPPVALAPVIAPEVHGAIIVGPAQPADPSGFADGVGELARRLGWPVLADGLSPLRNFASHVPHLVTTYDTILRNPSEAERLKPEVVICIGGWPTSKGLRAWLEASDAVTWVVSERPDNRDALHTRAHHVALSVSTFASLVPTSTDSNGYQQMWARQEERARVALDERLRDEQSLFEPKVAWVLAQHLPSGTPLFVSNSMPIRDLEYVSPATDRALRPLCNRGANGIDGTLSTALGVAHGADQPAVLLTGDLALLHDSNGFLLNPKLKGSLTIVLINNRGGGIFEHLPIAAYEPPFEEFFATPQSVDFEKLCSAHGIGYHTMYHWEDFIHLIEELPSSGIRVIELVTDRKGDAQGRKRLFSEVAEALTNPEATAD
jgi:2-succinyl-5-enolpyruvyl-6-hydroxy-3-cyclohexene-1-carboxylate synthase